MKERNIAFACYDIHVEVEGKEVVKGVSIEVGRGEKHAIMGPNGSGKSSLANALAGHPNYAITSGQAYIEGKNLLEMDATERSRAGLFLAFQYPLAIPGVTVSNFLRSAIKARQASAGNAGNGDNGNSEDALRNFRKELMEKFELLEVEKSFATRYVNDGFSGGEKKRLEILQMAMLKPKIAILDETDSGLDIDALKVVSRGINQSTGNDEAVILVTHYQRILNYVKPDRVHVMIDGKIVRSGGPELALHLEEHGYDWMKQEANMGT
jgi:Fe-S cluster assembly ATP-binding protein